MTVISMDLYKKRGLPPGGQPPQNGDMEARLSALEERADRVERKIDAVDGRLVHVSSKLEHVDREAGNLKWWILGSLITTVLTVIGTVVATGVGIQQMTVTTFQAATDRQSTQQPQPAQVPPIIINVPPAPTASASQ